MPIKVTDGTSFVGSFDSLSKEVPLDVVIMRHRYFLPSTRRIMLLVLYASILGKGFTRIDDRCVRKNVALLEIRRIPKPKRNENYVVLND